MHIIFEGVLMLFTIIVKTSSWFSKLQLAKLGAYFERQWY